MDMVGLVLKTVGSPLGGKGLNPKSPRQTELKIML